MATKRKRIEVPPLDIQKMSITLVGDTPLITHRFSEKAKKAILDKQQKKPGQGREIRDPEAEFEAALYKIPGSEGLYGFPATGFKSAAVRGAKNVPDIAMIDARGFFHIVCEDHRLVVLKYDDMEMVEDTVVIGRGITDLRYRPYFYGWSTDITLEYNTSVISPSQIVMLFDLGGFCCGVGERRPEKGDSYGRFHVKKEDE